MTNLYGDEESERNRVERLPQSAERAISQENLRAALDVTRRVHRANQTDSRAEPPSSESRWALNEYIRGKETSALFEWAILRDLLLDADEFTRRWVDYGRVEGGEHQIFQDQGVFYKRNNLAFHTSYLEYFERLVLHNWLFPDTMYLLEGLMLVIEPQDDFSQLRPVVSQKALRAVRGATRAEVESLMRQLGFIRRYEDNYVNTDQTLFIEDLHDQNVLVDASGDLLIFDPVIYLTKPGT